MFTNKSDFQSSFQEVKNKLDTILQKFKTGDIPLNQKFRLFLAIGVSNKKRSTGIEFAKNGNASALILDNLSLHKSVLLYSLLKILKEDEEKNPYVRIELLLTYEQNGKRIVFLSDISIDMPPNEERFDEQISNEILNEYLDILSEEILLNLDKEELVNHLFGKDNYYAYETFTGLGIRLRELKSIYKNAKKWDRKNNVPAQSWHS